MIISSLHLLQTPTYKIQLRQCIHCGMCLQACPTYNLFGTEMDSPRGRIALIKAASDGRLSPVEFQHQFTQHILLCLACRSCETACPSGVKYGKLIEEARFVVEHNRNTGLVEKFLRWMGVQQLMPRLGLLKTLAGILWLYEGSGLQSLIRRFKLLPPALSKFENILPPISLNFLPRHPDINQTNQQPNQVLFFSGCIQEAFLARVNQATVRVLNRNGYQVVTPSQQTCCGAAHLHLGDLEGAKQLARHNIDVFRSFTANGDYKIILCNAGGCGLSLKEYPGLLADDPVYYPMAVEFAKRVQDVSEFLFTHLTVLPQGMLKQRVVYTDSCHLRHGQKIIKQPRQLLKKIPGLELIELSFPDRCCGSAGVYNLSQAETASAILDAKIKDIAAKNPDLIVTTNTGCHMQLLAGVRKAGLSSRVMHIMEVIDLSYQTALQ